MILQCKESAEFIPHPEGIHPAVCLDVLDMGLMEVEFQGQRRMVNKVKLVFESEQKMDDGRNFTVSKNFTASLNLKAKLAEFLGKWRGRPVVPGESVDMNRLVGACCTLVISHQLNKVGRPYASIDAISKPTKRVVPSGGYDPAAARQRLAEWKAKQVAAPRAYVAAPNAAAGQPSPGPAGRPLPSDGRGASPQGGGGDPWTHSSGSQAEPKSGVVAAPPANAAPQDYDPEVGF
jgi:hypothetical protein